MIIHDYKINFQNGVTSVPAMYICRTALEHKDKLKIFQIKKDDKTINGMSILSILGLAMTYRSEIQFIIECYNENDEQQILNLILDRLDHYVERQC